MQTLNTDSRLNYLKAIRACPFRTASEYIDFVCTDDESSIYLVSNLPVESKCVSSSAIGENRPNSLSKSVAGLPVPSNPLFCSLSTSIGSPFPFASYLVVGLLVLDQREWSAQWLNPFRAPVRDALESLDSTRKNGDDPLSRPEVS